VLGSEYIKRFSSRAESGLFQRAARATSLSVPPPSAWYFFASTFSRTDGDVLEKVLEHDVLVFRGHHFDVRLYVSRCKRHIIVAEGSTVANEHKLFRLCLGYQHPIKRIVVMPWK